jgi:hypothetical protein
MALVNPNIAMSYRGVEMPQQNALADYAAIQQIQGGRQAQELNALKMQEAQAAMQERNALRQLNPAAADYESQLFKVSPTLGIQFRKERSAADASAAATAKSGFDLKAAQRKFGEDLKRGLSANPSDANIIAFGEDAVLQGLYSPDQVKSTVEQLLALPPADRVRILSQAGASAGELKPTFKSVDIGGAVNLVNVPAFGGAPAVIGTAAKTMAPGEAQRLQNDATRIKQEGQRLGLEGRRVAVLEENNRRDADPVFQQRISAARATGEAIAKGDVAAMQALPKVISRAEEGMRLIDELVGKRDSKTGALLDVETVDPRTGKTVKVKSKPHPGFSGSVGATWLPGARFVQGTDEAGFMSRYDQIKDASFLEAFESLKGGGAITEKEGAKATSAINRMSVATDEKEFIRAAMDLQDVIRTGVKNAQSRASRSGGAGTPAATGIDTSNPLLR